MSVLLPTQSTTQCTAEAALLKQQLSALCLNSVRDTAQLQNLFLLKHVLYMLGPAWEFLQKSNVFECMNAFEKCYMMMRFEAGTCICLACLQAAIEHSDGALVW